MPNPVIGETTLTLSDGREFTIAFSAGALIHAETIYGKPAMQIMAEAGEGFLGAVSALLSGALRKHHPEIGQEEAAGFALTDALAVRQAVDRAALLAFPEAGEGKKGANPPGKNSGDSGAKPALTRKSSGTPRRARSS